MPSVEEYDSVHGSELPPGLILVPNIVSEDYEKELLDSVNWEDNSCEQGNIILENTLLIKVHNNCQHHTVSLVNLV